MSAEDQTAKNNINACLDKILSYVHPILPYDLNRSATFLGAEHREELSRLTLQPRLVSEEYTALSVYKILIVRFSPSATDAFGLVIIPPSNMSL